MLVTRPVELDATLVASTATIPYPSLYIDQIEGDNAIILLIDPNRGERFTFRTLPRTSPPGAYAIFLVDAQKYAIMLNLPLFFPTYLCDLFHLQEAPKKK